jgi:hypothetical protein
VKSFADVSLEEAVARQSLVELVLKPARAGHDARLASRFLAFAGRDRLVLAVPRADGRPAYVPAGSRASLAFTVGTYFLQAPTTVLGLCPWDVGSARRADALLVQRPRRIASVDRRSSPRVPPAAGKYVFVIIWPAKRLAGGDCAAPHSGRLLNQSVGGLGVRLETPLTFQVGDEVILRLEHGQAEEFPIFRAVLKHQERDADGFWLAGFGDAVELAPGQAGAVIEAIAAGRV